MRVETMGIFACLGGYALTSNAPSFAQNPRIPTPPRAFAPLGEAALGWRAKQLLEAAQMDWEEASQIAAQAPEMGLEAWEIAQILDETRPFAPVATLPIAATVTGVRQGEPHRVSMDEIDYELSESLQGEF